jgi:hypothetical protein
VALGNGRRGCRASRRLAPDAPESAGYAVAVRRVSAVVISAGLVACSTLLEAPSTPGAVPHECEADSYLYAGRGTMNDLGILHPDRIEPAAQGGDTPGMFWVPAGTTRTYDRDDGHTEEVGIFCAVLDDGGTLLNLPVRPGWSPP